MLNSEYSWETLRNNLKSTYNILNSIRLICPKTHIIKLGTMGEYGTPNIDIEEGDNILIISSNRNEETMTRFFQGNRNV